ncbi:MAG: phosphate acyltransferase PlsX [Clostridia bacterium]|nr:phosphate acyltransferase PlsX [Clostridia bacterium]
MKKRKIILDLFGSDDPSELIRGAAEASAMYDDVVLMITGDGDVINNVLNNYTFTDLSTRNRIGIIPAREIITNGESPVSALRSKKDATIVKALYALRDDDEAVGLIAAGNTGAVLAGSVLILGKAEGVLTPSVLSLIPVENGGVTCILDCGARVDCEARHLVQYALIGTAFMESFAGKSNPSVALLSIGTEDTKGNRVTKEAYTALKALPINFQGNTEACDILRGKHDVIVCDGFTGNVVIKAVEGTVRYLSELFQKTVHDHRKDDEFIKSASIITKNIGQALDFNTLGGAYMLGIRKPLVKLHGAAKGICVKNAVGQILALAEGGYMEKINRLLAKYSRNIRV